LQGQISNFSKYMEMWISEVNERPQCKFLENLIHCVRLDLC